MFDKNEPVYLDHAATTPMRPEVAEAMAPYASEFFGNPSSTHRFGRKAMNALEEARERLAGALGAKRREVVFTGGGTEADNIAVLGAWRTRGEAGAWVVTSAIEHSAVRGAAAQAGREGARVALLGVDENALVDLGALDELLALEPAVVSVMVVNNEVGTRQPVEAIAERCRERGVPYHADAVQALGRVPVRVDALACDMLAISAHKVAGPKGVGALFLREGSKTQPITHGGGQEASLRPGTQNVAGAVGFALAAELAVAELEAEARRLEALRDRLADAVRAVAPGATVNAAGAPRAPHVLSMTIPDVDQDALLIGLDLAGVAASGGSACHSGAAEPSHVLLAMGAPTEDCATVRFSFGHTTTEADVERAARGVADALRTMAPTPTR